MKANTRRGARLAFDDVAALYDQARPRIPEHLVTTLMEITGLGPGDPVLEIGAETGQLTLPLRAAGLRITAVEPGQRLRDLLSQHIAADDCVTVLGGLFEDYQGPDAAYAAVVSANAWQWINPAVSYAKAADLLREDGHLALIWNFPIVAEPFYRRT